MRALALAVVLVLGAGASSLAAEGAPTGRRSLADIDAARQRALTPGFQHELPSPGAGPLGAENGSGAERPTGPVERRDLSIDTRDFQERRAQDTGPLGELMSFLLWGVLLVMVVLLAIWLGGELVKGEDTAELPPDGAAADADAATAAIIERPLGDADELARRGEFAEAIHTLLLRTLQELVRSAAVRVERSHTSREILARVPLLADAREALSGLITAVELTHFGDEPASAADYDRCRREFHRFAAAFRSSGLGAAPREPRAVPA